RLHRIAEFVMRVAGLRRAPGATPGVIAVPGEVNLVLALHFALALRAPFGTCSRSRLGRGCDVALRVPGPRFVLMGSTVLAATFLGALVHVELAHGGRLGREGSRPRG